MATPAYFLKEEDTLLRLTDAATEVWTIQTQQWEPYLPLRRIDPDTLRRIDKDEADAYIAMGEEAKGPRQPSLAALEKLIGRRGSRSTSRSRSE